MTVRDRAKLEAEVAFKAKLSEREIQMAGMQRQIEEFRGKSEQGSQQAQGEALELELETLLRGRFPRYQIEPVPKLSSVETCSTRCSVPKVSSVALCSGE